MQTTLKVSGKNILVKENILDKSIRILSPERANNRFKHKVQAAYVGATGGRTFAGWSHGAGETDTEVLKDLDKLRDRSSDLVRNNPIACAAVKTNVTNVVGAGLRYQCRIDRDLLGLGDDEADKIEQHAEREFALFADSKSCDAANTSNFYQQQPLAYFATLGRGDHFIIPREITRANTVSPYKLALQHVDASRVSNQSSVLDNENLAGGIETDKYGAPINYHVTKKSNTNIFTHDASDWVIISARGRRTGRPNIIHMFDRLTPGQRRGIPYLAPVIESLKQIGRFTEAELMAAVLSGMFTIFIESENDPSLSSSVGSDEAGYEIGNGAIIGLNPGDKVQTSTPGRPNAAFDPFFLAIVKQIGAALEIPYEIILKSFTKSYSASKAAFNEAWRYFRMRRRFVVTEFCNPVLELFWMEAVSTGRIHAPGFLKDPLIRKAYLGADWVGPTQGQLNPKDEAIADKMSEEMNWKTGAQNAGERGNDWDKTHKQRKKERALKKKDDLLFEETKQGAPVKPEDDNEKDDDDDDVD